MIKPEHKGDCEYITRAIFEHDLKQRKVINERDVIKSYYIIKQGIEKEFENLDVNKLVQASGLF